MRKRTGCIATLSAGAIVLGPDALRGQDTFPPADPDVFRVVNSVAFSPAGDEIYFAALYRPYLESLGRSDESAPQTALFSVRRTDGSWSAPELLPFSGRFPDYEPAVSGDGELMVFNSRRPHPDGRSPERNDLWLVRRSGDGPWSDPAPIESVNTFEHEESYASLSDDGTLVFVAGRPDPAGRVDYDLFTSRFSEGGFEPPERHAVSTERWGEGDPWIAPDGSYLIFTRWDETVGWTQTVDLFITYFDGTGWSQPISLDELNTDGPDFGAAVSPDGLWLHYRADSRFRRVALGPVLDRYRPIGLDAPGR